MSDELLSRIDAAVNAAQESECACGCRRELKPGGPSPYFAGQDCQTSWHLQQHAIADGEPERAEEMRRQRGEDPIDRLRRRVRELGRSDEERVERERLRLRVVDWLGANRIDPMRVAENYPIITTPTSITVHDYTRDEEDQVCLVGGEVETVELTYPLVTPWPADLEWEHHRHEPDEEALDDRRPEDLLTSVAGAASLLGHGEQVDATDLLGSDPLAYRVRCLGCGLRGTPLDAEVRPEQDGLERRHWVCDCGTYMSTSDVTATVERFSQADGLHLRLGYGRELAHYVLPGHLLGSYDSLDPIWREMEQLVATSVRLPWSNPRSNPLRDMQEVAEQAYQRGAGTISVAPVGAVPGGDGWVDVGWTADPGFSEPAGDVVIGVDVAADGSGSVVAGYHTPDGGMAYDLLASAIPSQRAAWNWARSVERVRLSAEQAAVVLNGIAAATHRAAERLRAVLHDDQMLRAIEAKKNQAHGPQRKKRAPRRIDPRRGR